MAKPKENGKEEHIHMHCCGGGKIIWGIILVAVGIAIETGWDFGQILILVGGILLVKGLLVKAKMRD